MYFCSQFFLRLLLWIFSHNQSTFFSNSLVLGVHAEFMPVCHLFATKDSPAREKKVKTQPKNLSSLNARECSVIFTWILFLSIFLYVSICGYSMHSREKLDSV